jgi:hypothetical protein
MFLASELHMTLAQLWENCTAAELRLWHTYYSMKAEDREKERNR